MRSMSKSPLCRLSFQGRHWVALTNVRRNRIELCVLDSLAKRAGIQATYLRTSAEPGVRARISCRLPTYVKHRACPKAGCVLPPPADSLATIPRN